MSRPSKGQYILGAITVFSVAIALRMGPLFWSPLPFNPDGIVYAGLVRETIANGALPLEGLPVDSFLFTAFLTVLELVVDEPARYISQPVIAVVGALPCMAAIILGSRVGGYLRWNPGRRRLAGLVAGGILAVDGVYLHRSMPVDEQTVGLLVVPLVVLGLVHAQQSGQRRWYGVVAVLLVALPPLHNLDSIVVLFMLCIVVFMQRITRRNLIRGGALILGFGLYFVAYSWGIAALTPATVIQSGRISYAPGLLLAWLILITFALAKLTRLRARTQRLLLAAAFSSLLGLSAVNAVRPIFPGTQTTPTVLFVMAVPLLVPILLGIWILPRVERPAPVWTVSLSLVGSGFVLIGMAFTATLTPEYINTAYRAQTFLHFPMSVFAGAGVVALTVRFRHTLSTPTLRQSVGAVAIVLVLLCAAASIPIAFGGLELLSYKGTTTPGEFAAAEFGATHLGESWAADDHIARVSRYFQPRSDLLNYTAGRVQPVYTWVKAGGRPPDCPTVTQASWSTTGAQFYPRAPASIPAERLGEWERTHSIIYRSSTPDAIAIGLTADSDGAC